MAKRRNAAVEETVDLATVHTDGQGNGGLTADELTVLAAEASERQAARGESREKKEPKTPRERFLGNAAKRVNKALKAIDAVARCGNRKQYEYTQKEGEAIIDALTGAVSVACDAFSDTEKVDKGSFKLPVE